MMKHYNIYNNCTIRSRNISASGSWIPCNSWVIIFCTCSNCNTSEMYHIFTGSVRFRLWLRVKLSNFFMCTRNWIMVLFAICYLQRPPLLFHSKTVAVYRNLHLGFYFIYNPGCNKRWALLPWRRRWFQWNELHWQ